MGQPAAEEIRKEVLEEDGKKDVSIYLSIPIGVLAAISSMAAVCAVIVMRALVYFRHGVDAYWLTCVPFLFPVITGLFAAYKKQFSLLGVHLVVNILALLTGGFGFGLSLEPIFINRHQCVRVTPNVICDKTTLAYIYLVMGSASAGFAVLGFLLTLCALNSATKRMATRRYRAELEHLREQEVKQKELHQMKLHGDVKATTFPAASPPPPTSQNTASNGVAQVPQEITSGAAGTKTLDDATTKL